jgi:hypothetical protein
VSREKEEGDMERETLLGMSTKYLSKKIHGEERNRENAK